MMFDAAMTRMIRYGTLTAAIGTLAGCGELFGVEKTKLSLIESAATIEVGERRTLSATVSPADRTLSWRSSDESVAYVDGFGEVLGKGAGNATVTAEVDGEPAVTASARILVRAAAVARMSVTPASLTLPRDASRKLSVFIRDRRGLLISNRTVLWRSNNPSVASVSADGTVRGVNLGGPVTLTATVDTVSTSIAVTVRDLPACATVDAQAVASISISSILSTSCDAGDGQRARAFSVSVPAPTTLRVLAFSTTLDVRLLVGNAAGERIGQDDDTGGGTNALVQIPVNAGTYRIYVISNDVGATGTIWLGVGGASELGCNEVRILRQLDVRSDALSSSQPCVLSGSKPAHSYFLPVTSGGAARLQYSGYSPAMILMDAQGTVRQSLTRTGASGTLDMPVNVAPGLYFLTLTTLVGPAIGSYTVSFLR